jgi:hypothetical protein
MRAVFADSVTSEGGGMRPTRAGVNGRDAGQLVLWETPRVRFGLQNGAASPSAEASLATPLQRPRGLGPCGRPIQMLWTNKPWWGVAKW